MKIDILSCSFSHRAPSEHKTVQARIVEYAEAIDWTFVPCEEIEHWRGFDPAVPPADATPKRKAPCSGTSAISIPTSTATGASALSNKYISQYIASNQELLRYLAIYCDLTKLNY
ncbi:MAG: hypothetical protein ACYCZE_07940 [Thiobacillus sp.]